ncbi:hypothetical protein [uncultured Actinomyces sp.]|uniref:hypothetical protein n=1 Tax=uncultured Actinomyces sp. TaxID=249061 RepID=UPI002621364F|nr:hypothetical protein [uncultured Actinomyces sp.]
MTTYNQQAYSQNYTSDALAALVAKQTAYGAFLGPDAVTLIGAELQAQQINPTNNELEAADRALCSRQVDGAAPPRIPDIIRAIRAQTIQAAMKTLPPALAGLLARLPEARHEAIKREYFSTVKAGVSAPEAVDEITHNHKRELENPQYAGYQYQPQINQ